MHWLSIISICYLSFFILFTANYILVLFDLSLPLQDYLIAIGHSLLISLMVYMGMNQKSFLSDPVIKLKYATSSIAQGTSRYFFQKLDKFMIDEKPYLEAGIRLKDLSEKMGISTNQLSQVINQNSHLSFGDYINSYRVKEAYHLLSTSSDPIINIAYQVGFNNKTTFYQSFKKNFGYLPSKVSNKGGATRISY